MNGWPSIGANGRGRRLVIVALLALLQAMAAGTFAMATRESFAALGEGAHAPFPVFSVTLIAISAVLLALFRWKERILAEQIGQEFAASLRLRLFKHILRLPANELTKRRVSGLSLRFAADLTAIREWVSRGITRLLSAAIVIPVVWCVLVHINRELATATLVPVLLGMMVMGLAGLPLMAAHRRLRNKRSRLTAGVTKQLPHAGELRLLGRLAKENAQIRSNTEQMITAVLHRERLAVLIRVVPDVMGGYAIAAMLWTALSSQASTAETAGAIAALGMVVQKMRELGSVWNRYCAWVTAKNRCLVLLAIQPLPEKRSYPGKQPKLQTEPGVYIRLAQVHAAMLKGVDASASPGQKIGIVGANGSGKSKLLQLIACMELPSRGEIRIDGERATVWAGLSSKRLMYLGPHSPVLSGSLRRCLSLGLPQRPNDATIEATALRYGLGNLIHRLGGIRGRIAENGRNLSTGELRRILLARAALCHADLLLLDDPVASMDATGRALVRQLVREAQGTVLITAPDRHCLSGVDTLWQIENGMLRIRDLRASIHTPLALLTSPSQKSGLFLEPPGHSYAVAAAGATPYSLT